MEKRNSYSDRRFREIWEEVNLEHAEHSNGQVEESWEIFRRKLLRRKKFRRYVLFAKVTAVVAAVVLVVILVKGYWFVDDRVWLRNEGIIPMEFTLADGSKVSLGNFSAIAYSPDFGKNERSISLYGEAFFEVNKDREKPFIVKAHKTITTVWGTSFNIKVDSALDREYVSLYTGRVRVAVEGRHKIWDLSSGEQLRYENKRVGIGKFDPLLVDAWRREVIDLNQVKLRRVFEVLEAKYRIVVICSNKELLNRKVTLRIRKEDSVEQILKVISLITGIKWHFGKENHKIRIQNNR